MILANSVVDVIDEPPAHGQGLGKFRVTVFGKEPHDFVRIYEVQAKDDSAAARECLDRFITEVEKLITQDN
jgi:hypothetical protein